ncbi:hypothetical protein ABL78_7609 [Leptomonas seymouri]|uniref:Uncharacterized protein n=1 Tax=Leptomonas seymouri TaxID=5684 RepID=A0A0N1HTR7_LEPSE|nr:hypothetical protein ABL78_7609 [Leptomonas seymouri]|eukprot:KPI83361.1 hypothetical protein ABL78_7609 [Leptomonas seymouri]
MNNYYTFVLLSILVVVICISCAVGLRARRRRIAAAAHAQQRYTGFSSQADANNGNSAAYAQGAGQDGNYANIYYQQQQSHPGGMVTGPGTGLYYPASVPPYNTSSQPGAPPVSATVLYAASPGSPEPNINFGSYFPEAQVVSGGAGGANTAHNGGGGNNTGALGPPSPAEASPYGEADYVPRLSPQQVSHTQRRSSSADPTPPGVAPIPLPQYAAPSPQAGSDDKLVDYVRKGKELD